MASGLESQYLRALENARKYEVAMRKALTLVKKNSRSTGEKRQREAEALLMIRASNDLDENQPIAFEHEKGKIFVRITLWDGREKVEMVGWDEFGPYSYGAGAKWRWSEDLRRKDSGTVYRQPDKKRF